MMGCTKDNDVLNSSTSQNTIEGEVLISEHGNKADFDEILSDLDALYSEISSVENSVLSKELGSLKEKLNRNETVNVYDFLSKSLGIPEEFLSVFSDYSVAKRKILDNEFSNSSSNSLEYYYSEHENSYNFYIPSLSREKAQECAPDCCGGWRPVRLTGELAACLGAPNVWTCGWYAYDIVGFFDDGCLRS
jgi:hypothetical protein